MHSYLEKYIKKEGIKTKETDNSKIAFQLCKSIIDNIFPNIDKFIASEATIHEDCNYAGRLDLLAEIDGELTVIDYKSSFRKKSSYQIDEHFQQLAAYASAHDKMFNTKIEKAMIFIAYKDTFEHEVLEADSSSLNTYKDMWMDKQSIAEMVYERRIMKKILMCRIAAPPTRDLVRKLTASNRELL